MKLRRTIRKTIQAGSTAIGTAISYHNGRASVRLGGAVFTNLTAMGKIEPGQSVIIDYSTGTAPIVRPQTVPVTPVLPRALQVTTDRRKEDEEAGELLMEITRPDQGINVTVDYDLAYEFVGQYIYDGVEAAIYWRACESNGGYPIWNVLHDSGNMYSAYASTWGQPYVVVPQAGKYLITLDINLGYPWAFWWGVAPYYPSYYRVSLYGGGTLLAEETAWAFTSASFTSIASLDAGDQIMASLYARDMVTPVGGNAEKAFILFPWTEYPYIEAANVSMVVQLLAGTQVQEEE